MHREPLSNRMTLASLGTLATVLHACPSARALVTPTLEAGYHDQVTTDQVLPYLLSPGLFPLGLWMYSPLPLKTYPCTCSFPIHCLAFSTSTRVISYPTGSHYWRLDTSRDGWHSWPIVHQWPQGPSTVDAAFSWDNKVYLIQVCVGREA